MTKSQRWIKSTIQAAEACTTAMPWERGARRQAFIANRTATSAQKQTPSRIERPAA